MSAARRLGPRARSAGLALAAVLLPLLAAGAASSPAAAAAPAVAPVAATAAAQAAAPTGLDDLNACVNARTKAGGEPTVRLAVVIDESKSLGTSDPGTARVAAAKALVGQLAGQAARQGFTISALVAGFASDVDNSTGFQDLTTADLGTFNAAIDAFTQRDQGQDTDYWSAVQQIRSLFADARGAADPADAAASPCQAVVLVTDGQFDLTVRDTTKPYPGVEDTTIDSDDAKNRVVAAGAQDLCRRAGPVDALRVDHVTLIAVGLKGDGGNDPDFGLLKGMATGDGGCGAQPANGAFFEADDVSDLILILASIGSDSSTGTPVSKSVCAPGSTADDCTRSFVLSPAFTSAALVSAIDADGVGVQFTAADGKKPSEIDYDAAKPQGTVSVNGVVLAYQWYSARALSIDVTGQSSPSWNGTWKATFVDTTGQAGDAVAKTTLSVQPDLFVDATVPSGAQDGPRPGETTAVKFALKNGLGDTLTTLDRGLQVSATATVTSKAGGASPVVVRDTFSGADLAAPFDWMVPTDLPVGPAVLTVTTTVTYAGTAYEPTERGELIDIRAPFTVPPVNGTVIFSLIKGTKAGAGVLTLDPPQQGTGCVWVDGATLTAAPAALTDVTVTGSASSEADCAQVSQGGSPLELDLSITPAAEANGDLAGTVDVHLKPQGSGAVVVVPVRFTGTIERSVKNWVFWTVLGVCIALGVLVPAAVYAFVRRRGARFPTATLHHVTCPATVVGSRLEVGLDSHRQVLRIDPGQRSARAGDYALKAVVGWKPTEAGHAEIRRPGWVGVGEVSPYLRDGAAVVSVALGNSWSVFAREQAGAVDGDRMEAELFLVIPAATSDDRLQLLRERAASEFHRHHQQLHDAVAAPERELVGASVGPGGAGGAPGWVEPAPPSTGGWPTAAPGGTMPPAGPGTDAGSTPPTAPPAWGAPPAGGGGTPSAPSGWEPSADPTVRRPGPAAPPPTSDPSRGW